MIRRLFERNRIEMNYRKASWIDDQTVNLCTRCRGSFTFRNPKHHCRRCGLIFCDACSYNRMIVPAEELVPRPPNWLRQTISTEVASDEDNFRCPHRVCNDCATHLKDLQETLRQQVARANQDTWLEANSISASLPSIDFHLENEIGKATSMLLNFKRVLGEETIPRELLDISKGVVFLTILKAGFLFTGRYGTGLIVSKLPNGVWSAPSAVMISGVGWGIQGGAEVTDVMLILSSDSAVTAFKSRAQIAVGAELGVSVGPLGRSIESDVTAGNKGTAHAFSYAQSKGLFLGASLEATAIAARPDVNQKFYGEKVSVSDLLSGKYPSPKGASPLYEAIDEVLCGKIDHSKHEVKAKTTGGSAYEDTTPYEDIAPPTTVQENQ